MHLVFDQCTTVLRVCDDGDQSMVKMMVRAPIKTYPSGIQGYLSGGDLKGCIAGEDMEGKKND